MLNCAALLVAWGRAGAYRALDPGSGHWGNGKRWVGQSGKGAKGLRGAWERSTRKGRTRKVSEGLDGQGPLSLTRRDIPGRRHAGRSS